MASVLLIGTLDTKGQEYAFVRELVRSSGHSVIVMDLGVLEEPPFVPEIPADTVARAGGATLAALLNRPSSYGLRRTPMRVRERRDWVLRQMHELGLLDRAAYGRALQVPVTSLFRSFEEIRDATFVKAGQGLEIQHKGTQTGHRYQILGVMRSPHDRFEPLLVTLMERTEVFPLYQHPGTELVYMLEGRMEYSYGKARYVVEAGDTLQFNGEVTHGPTQLLELPIRFLSIKSRVPSAE